MNSHAVVYIPFPPKANEIVCVLIGGIKVVNVNHIKIFKEENPA